MLVYGASRYHIPLMPLIGILAAPELPKVVDWLQWAVAELRETCWPGGTP